METEWRWMILLANLRMKRKGRFFSRLWCLFRALLSTMPISNAVAERLIPSSENALRTRSTVEQFLEMWTNRVSLGNLLSSEDKYNNIFLFSWFSDLYLKIKATMKLRTTRPIMGSSNVLFECPIIGFHGHRSRFHKNWWKSWELMKPIIDCCMP